MKARIFLYLFIFAFMIVIFQFANGKKYSEAKEKEVANLEKHIDTLESQLRKIKRHELNSEESGDFSLKTNSNAREYFKNLDMTVDSVEAKIENLIIAQNQVKKDNPLVPYSSSSEGKAMRVNRIKILNNKWIIAQFTDGKNWGEALITYYLDENDEFQFNTEDGVLYNN